MNDQRTEQELEILKQLDEANEKITSLEEKIAAAADENASLKAEIERLQTTPDQQEMTNGVGDCFTLDGKKYKLLVPAVTIPKLGRRTALEILADEEAQAILVKIQSGVIKEVI